MLRSVWDLSSLTRDQTHIPCIGRWIPNHWTTRLVPCNKVSTLQDSDRPLGHRCPLTPPAALMTSACSPLYMPGTPGLCPSRSASSCRRPSRPTGGTSVTPWRAGWSWGRRGGGSLSLQPLDRPGCSGVWFLDRARWRLQGPPGGPWGAGVASRRRAGG